MSDYLWDKTGEPDEELERLETLLGTLAHQPRALELPAAARVEHAAHPFRLRATRPALAVAAALALMLLAGAWLFVSRRASDDGRTAALSVDMRDLRTLPRRPLKTSVALNNNAKHVEKPVEHSSRQQSARASLPARRRRHIESAVRENAGLSKKGSGAEALEERPKGDLLAVVMERQQTAKAQLVYALRLTGAKLSEVQTKVRGVGDERPASEGPNKIR